MARYGLNFGAGHFPPNMITLFPQRTRIDKATPYSMNNAMYLVGIATKYHDMEMMREQADNGRRIIHVRSILLKRALVVGNETLSKGDPIWAIYVS